MTMPGPTDSAKEKIDFEFSLEKELASCEIDSNIDLNWADEVLSFKRSCTARHQKSVSSNKEL